MKYRITVLDKWGTLQVAIFSNGKSTVTNETHWGNAEFIVSKKPKTTYLNSMEEWSVYNELDLDDMEFSNPKSENWIFSDDISNKKRQKILTGIEEYGESFLEEEEGWAKDFDILISAKIKVEILK